jgi:hypothetical protein
MRYSICSLAAAMALIATPTTVQASADDATCRASATSATGYTPPPPDNTVGAGRAGAAAKGAAAGAVVGGAQANQYGNASDAAQDKHRENQAKSGAAAGMAVAGSQNRQGRRDERRSEDEAAAWQTSYDACMAGK